MSETAVRTSATSAAPSVRRRLQALLLAFFCSVAVPTAVLAADADSGGVVRDDAPDRYIVQEGDTLWDISNVFLDQPWRWPDLWRVNPEIENPHLIYPGDVIRLRWVDGQPTLELARGPGARGVRLTPLDTERFEPRIRSTPLFSSIPTIDLEAIGPFLTANRVVSRETLDQAPYVVQGEAGRILVGANDQLYARGLEANVGDSFSILRSAGTFAHPDTGELLGLEAEEIGTAQVLATEGELSTLLVTASRADIRVGDRVVETEERAVNSNFFPSAPDRPVSGHMLAVIDGISQIGVYSAVAIDLGSRDGIAVGNVLAVRKAGPLVRDRIAKDVVRMPSSPGGLLMVFRVFEKVSYGIVLQSLQPLAVLDEVTNP
ncbi:MAG: LysM peptidoglycan-binding domain-containing protein [Pseudomonadales bacterium]|jgi:hypothetical protein|nr:LysM peptidoglycan-binding domain-containing protein [Pseudomonadales bacterium]